MLRAVLLLMVFSMVLAGCSFYRIDSSDTSSGFYPPKDSADQVVYLEKVDKPFDVIGTIRVSAQRPCSREEVVLKMRYEAAILGADAITDMTTDNAPLRVQYTAKAVVFK